MKIFGMMLLLAGMSVAAVAAVTVPEIDASAGISAVVLLSGALLIIRSRQKK